MIMSVFQGFKKEVKCNRFNMDVYTSDMHVSVGTTS